MLPADEAETLKAANPVDGQDIVRIGPDAIERPEDAIARIVLVGGPFVLVILGGAHDPATTSPG